MVKRNKNFISSEPLIFLAATPIGNLNDISKRLVETLLGCDLVAAEDTRNAYSLLNHLNIKKELFSLREHNENQASQHLIALAKNGKKIVYMSDAGYPGISDPGSLLVANALKENVNISVIPGPSAFIHALVASGLETNHFYFYGFLPSKESEAKTELENLKNHKETLIFYESPHRIDKTLNNLFENLGNRNICIGRELTKLNEEFIRGPLNEVKDIDPTTLKGEMVLILEGNKEKETLDESLIKKRIDYFLNKGLSKKDAIEVVCDEFKVNKNKIYKLTIEK